MIVEASSQGLATVSTHISGIPELLTDGENGFLTAPDDPDAFAAALEKAIRNPDLRQTYGARAEAKVRAHFDYHTSIADLGAYFESAFAAEKR